MEATTTAARALVATGAAAGVWGADTCVAAWGTGVTYN